MPRAMLAHIKPSLVKADKQSLKTKCNIVSTKQENLVPEKTLGTRYFCILLTKSSVEPSFADKAATKSDNDSGKAGELSTKSGNESSFAG